MPFPPRLLDPVELSLPRLPGALEGLRIAHLSDLHLRRRSRWPRRLAAEFAHQPPDLVALTGDYMNLPGDEQLARDQLARLIDLLHPRLGTFGVFGNHDTQQLRDLADDLPVHWLGDASTRLPDLPLLVMGMEMLFDREPDAAALAIELARHDPAPPGEPELRLMITHSPVSLATASDLRADLMLCGHTHGGQIRLPGKGALINSTDLPLDLTSGVLRHRETLAGVSRGIGFTGLVPRVLCRGHVPVYTLRRGNLAGRFCNVYENTCPW
ncbi:MAG: metallophosphoesterase [Phycisphaeraceae bacterium]